MEPEEAIGVLEYSPKQDVVSPKKVEAIKVGIEALKAIKQLCDWNIVFDTHKMPGETEE